LPKTSGHKSNSPEYLNSIETSLTKVNIRNDGVIEIRFKMDDYEVGVEDQIEIQDALVKLTENDEKKYHLMVIPGKYGGITKEAREKEMFANSAFQKQLSLAIVVQAMHQWIIGNLYLKLKQTKPDYPNKLFNTEEAAEKWILKLKKDKNKL